MKRRNATKARTAKNAKRDPDEARRNRADELRWLREAEAEEAAERWRVRFLVAPRPWSTGDALPWLPFARSAVRALGVDVREADHFERTGRFDPASANLPLLYDSTRWLWERAPRPAEACRVAVDALARLGGRARGLRAVAPAPRPGAWDALLLPGVGLYAVPTPEPGTEYERRIDARQREEDELLRVFREAEAAAWNTADAPPTDGSKDKTEDPKAARRSAAARKAGRASGRARKNPDTVRAVDLMEKRLKRNPKLSVPNAARLVCKSNAPLCRDGHDFKPSSLTREYYKRRCGK